MQNPSGVLVLIAIAASPSSAQLDPGTAPASLGPYGGPTHSVLLNPADPLELLVLAEFGGEPRLLRSTNGAASFVPVPSPWASGQDQTLRVDPASPHTLYLSSGERVFRSGDFGHSWTSTVVAPGSELRGIEVAPSGGAVIAYAWYEAWRSTDGGASWSSVLSSPADALWDVAFAPSDPLRVYVAASHGHVFRSVDGGSSFSLPSPQSGLLGRDIEALIVDPTSAEGLLAGALPGLFRSTDGGLTFTTEVTGLDPNFGWVEFWYEHADQRLWATLWGGTLAHSLGFGASWTHLILSAEGETLSPRELAFAPDGTRYLADYRGLLRSEYPAPQTWSRIGIANKRISEVALLAPGGDRLCVESKWLAVSALYRGAPGAAVAKVTDVPGVLDCYLTSQAPRVGALLVDPLDSDHWLASTYGSAWGGASVVLILSHRDGGTTIETVSCSVGIFEDTVVDLVFDPHAPSHLLAVAGDDTKWSTDSGDTWSKLTGLGGLAPAAMAFDPFTPGRILALLDPNPGAGIQTRASQSLDGGLSWSPPADAWPGGGTAVLLEADPWLPGVMYGGDTGTGLWRSLDGGLTFSPTGVSLHLDSELVLHSDFPGLLWVSAGDGTIQVSADAGTSFRDAVGLPSLFTLALGLAVDPSDGTLLFGTEEASFFELPGASPFVRLGPGTAGTGGHVPRHFANGQFPSVGNASYALVGDHIVGGGLVVPVVGLGELPFPLAGGTFWVDLVQGPYLILPPRIASGASGAAGAGAFLAPLPLPPNPGLVGATLVSQYAVIGDPGAADPSTIVLSDAVRATLIP